MKKYSEVQTISKVINEIRCDICKTRISIGYETNKGEISYEKGYDYPECGHSEILSIDICENCFHNKVKPLIENEFSIEFNQEETDY